VIDSHRRGWRLILTLRLNLKMLFLRSLSSVVSLSVPRLSVSQVRHLRNNRQYNPMFRELNKRRKIVETNYLLKDGKVPILKRAGEGLFNHVAEMAALEARLGETFDRGLLSQAFVTRAHVEQEALKQQELGVETAIALEDHQGLAHKGLECMSSTLERWLQAALPKFPEEGIKAVTQYLTSEELLADVGYHLGLRELVHSPVYPPSRTDLARTFSAVVGALAMRDLGRAEQLTVDILATQLQGKDLNSLWEVTNPMGLLVGLLEEQGRATPEARLLWQSGPGSILASYTVGIYVDRELIGESPGETLDIAEEMAARDALRNIFLTCESSGPLPWGRLPSPQPAHSSQTVA